MNHQELFFDFWECILLLKSTGRKARDLRELRDVLATVSDQSIYHHTHEYFVKDIGVEYTNDFAHWAGEFLEERSLAEQLSIIDPFNAGKIQDVRAELLATIDAYLTESPSPRAVWPGDEICFNEAVSVIFRPGSGPGTWPNFFWRSGTSSRLPSITIFMKPGCG